jgi:alpha-galactosidase
MGTSYSVALDLRDKDVIEPASRLLNQYRSIKPLLESDFYPLTPYSLEENVWMAWQYDVPEKGEGLVQAFRRPNSQIESMTFRLCGLEPQAAYQLADIDGTALTEMTGLELMNSGLPIILKNKPEVAVIKYQKKK